MRLTTASVDSALGRWTHHACEPPDLPPALAGVVRAFWHFDGHTTLLRERTFPGGHLEIIVHLGPRYRAVDRGATGDPFPVACLTGVQTGPLVVEAPAERCRVLGVRLHPVGAYALLGAPLDATEGRTLDLTDGAGRAAAELAERCHDAPNVSVCFGRAGAWILERLVRTAAHGAVPHPAVAWAAAELERVDGVASITALRAQAGLGRTRFADAFRQQVGMGPKRYARVLRFRRALALVRSGHGLSAAALAAGYYDQAHLHACFREFAGMTPGAYAAATGYPNSPSLAESAGIDAGSGRTSKTER
ncbi:MAG TPA: helix-turn-helix domain-containing protein [Gemmatirosa sp.]